MKIHQDAWFSLAKFSDCLNRHYAVKRKGNSVYVFVIKGKATVNGLAMNERDGLGVWDTNSFDVQAAGDAEILLMNVTMDVTAAARR